jgi:hypothetical protein
VNQEMSNIQENHHLWTETHQININTERQLALPLVNLFTILWFSHTNNDNVDHHFLIYLQNITRMESLHQTSHLRVILETVSIICGLGFCTLFSTKLPWCSLFSNIQTADILCIWEGRAQVGRNLGINPENAQFWSPPHYSTY